MFQVGPCAISVALDLVPHQVHPDPFIHPRSQHPILEGMAQAVKAVLVRFEQPVLAQELVDRVGQAGIVSIAGEAVRELPEGFQTDADQWNDPF